MKKKTVKFEKTQVVHSSHDNQVFNLSNFKHHLQVSIHSLDQQKIQLDLVGLDPAIANALRRIIIAQVPTMALHQVFLYQNTSVLPDQLLVHRLGLLPIDIDAQHFSEKKGDDELNEKNSLKFTLKVQCKRKELYREWTEEEIEKKNLKPEEYLDNSVVYSKDLEWVPQGNQKKTIKNVSLVYGNILLAKLRQNQQIWLDIYAEKGIGKRHSKWSPVSTAFYRLMPQIELEEEFDQSKNAEKLVNCCPVDVFQIKKKKAVVVNPRSCTTCRQCLNYDGVSLQKVKDHFLFTIESTGILKPSQIFVRALAILEEKSKAYSL